MDNIGLQFTNESLPFFFAAWLAIFVTGWTVWIVLLRNGIHYINRFIFTSFYFLGFSVITAVTFRDLLQSIVVNFSSVLLVPVVAVVALFFFTYFLSRRFLKKPEKAMAEQPEDFNLPMDYRYIISKHFEILFQQTTILVLVLLLQKTGLTLAGIVVCFVVLFGVLHVPLIKTTGRFFGLYYTIFAMLSGLVFPTLITQFRYGFAYSFMVHVLFYIATGVFFWVYFAKKEHTA